MVKLGWICNEYINIDVLNLELVLWYFQELNCTNQFALNSQNLEYFVDA